MLSINVVVICSISCTPKQLDSGDPSPFSMEEQGHLNFMLIQPSEPIEPDATNIYRNNPEAISFGELLFSSPDLSSNGEISCASCHQYENHFTDALAQSKGLDITNRSAPTLIGLQRQRWFNWDGSCDTAWCQAIGPLEKDGEMGSSRIAISRLVFEKHKQEYESIFGPLPSDINSWPNSGKPSMEGWSDLSQDVQMESTRIIVNIAKSIDAFEYTLDPPHRRFDEFLDLYKSDHQKAYDSLTSQERHGLDLFLNEGRCVLCHSGSTLSNGEFHNIGLGERTWLEPLDLGRYDGIDILRANEFNSAGQWSDEPTGIKSNRISRLNQKTEQLGQFKTPTLREVNHTGPYMHGGHFDTLEEVLQYYVNLDEEPVHGHRDETLQPLDWSSDDIDAILAFLQMASE